MNRHAGVDSATQVNALRQALAAILAATLVLAPAAQAERTHLKPGWNMFSTAQDVELGRQVSQDAERQLPILNDAKVNRYVNDLGRRLAAKAPGETYPYQFKVVNDKAINAFAMPGGFVYVNRGVIETADNEAQLAGVMGHEIGHVALRHGTNQATKAMALQFPLAVMGGMMGGGWLGQVTQIVGGFGLNSVLLKYSRDAERQADIVGTQILYDTGYDPRAMSQFFQKIEEEGKGGRPMEFFSSHPNPENRVQKVNQEITNLGAVPASPRTDSAQFREIKRQVLALPEPPKAGRAGSGGSAGGDARSGRPPQPSERLQAFENERIRLRHPDNWRANSQGDAASFVPEGGVVDDGRGNQAVAYGVMLNVFEPHNDRYGEITLEEATDQLVEELRHSNPRMRVVREHERIRVGAQRALSVMLSNDSPLGGRETDWLVTVLRPEGVLFFVFVAPQREFDSYEPSFQALLDSVRFVRR